MGSRGTVRTRPATCTFPTRTARTPPIVGGVLVAARVVESLRTGVGRPMRAQTRGGLTPRPGAGSSRLETLSPPSAVGVAGAILFSPSRDVRLVVHVTRVESDPSDLPPWAATLPTLELCPTCRGRSSVPAISCSLSHLCSHLCVFTRLMPPALSM